MKEKNAKRWSPSKDSVSATPERVNIRLLRGKAGFYVAVRLPSTKLWLIVAEYKSESKALKYIEDYYATKHDFRHCLID